MSISDVEQTQRAHLREAAEELGNMHGLVWLLVMRLGGRVEITPDQAEEVQRGSFLDIYKDPLTHTTTVTAHKPTAESLATLIRN